MISCLAWIPRTHVADKPITYELSADERMQIAKAQAAQIQEGESDKKDDDFDADMDELTDVQLAEMNLNDGSDEDDAFSDAEDNELQPNDVLLMTCTVDEEDEFSSLEVHVYDRDAGSLYVHHDIALPAFPLCVEWVGIDPGESWSSTKSTNYAAVGTVEPNIEVWNLDVMDALEPNAVLSHHTSSVLTLSWNELRPALLASGSADQSVVVWDLPTKSVTRSFNNVHSDKVQCVKWNPAEASVLLTGSMDATARVFDERASDAKSVKYDALGQQVEACAWDFHNPARFCLALEDGRVAVFDVRAGPEKGPLFQWQAHSGSCTTIVPNRRVVDMYATASTDKSVKLWDLSSPSGPEGVHVAKMKAHVGKLFTGGFCFDDDPFLLAVGGSKGKLALWHADAALSESEEDISNGTRVKDTFNQERILATPRSWPRPEA